jgi:hypothetical protein
MWCYTRECSGFKAVKKNKIHSYFSSYNEELNSKMKRLDELIGKDHWLSVGTYKEKILRDLLKKALPHKYSVSHGFLLSMAQDQRIIKSKQIDILIWDSSNYAPIFVDDDFVICPPEACRAIIEVKSTLSNEKLKQSLINFDYLCDFANTHYISSHGIRFRKYIFSYQLDTSMKFPNNLFNCMENTYSKDNEAIRFEDRIKIFKCGSIDEKIWTLGSVDGVYILNHGAIKKDYRGSKDGVPRMKFKSYITCNSNYDHTYSFFEYDLQSFLGSINNTPGLWYAAQPGLYSTKKGLDITKINANGELIIPRLPDSDLKPDEKEKLYRKKETR